MKLKYCINGKFKLILTSVFILNFGLINNSFGRNSISSEPIPPIPSAFNKDKQLCVKSELGVSGDESGVLLVGTVVADPWYVKGEVAKHSSVELSHTHILIEPLGKTKPSEEYEMAADNVFALGYDDAQPKKQVPSPLNQLLIGTKIEACGFTYTQKPQGRSKATQGIHWVHIENKDGSRGGWVKVINPQGIVGENLENNPEYLYLWPPKN